jgi:hypothetical protein
MNRPLLILNTDNCVTINNDRLDKSKYLGPIVIMSIGYSFWKNNCYQQFDYDDINDLDKNVYLHCYLNSSNPVPNHIKIFISEIYLINLKKLPQGLEICCCLSVDLNKLNAILPIGLKYLCLSSINISDKINKIKMPFGCKLIIF